MEESQIHVDDLYTAVLPRLVELQSPSDVHFNSDGNQFMAERVVKAIEFMLYLRKVLPPAGRRTDKTNQ